MKECIFQIDSVLVNEETGECCIHLKFVAKLIRCNDCKWFNQGYCVKYDRKCLRPIDFCSMAERKEDAE